MNVRLPEAQDSIATLRQVGVAGTISSGVLCLNDRQRARVLGRVGVPEVAVPLNDQVVVGQVGINDELTVDDVLLGVGDTQSFEDDAAGDLKRRGTDRQRTGDEAWDTSLLLRSVPAGVRAAPIVGVIGSVSIDVERLSAGLAHEGVTIAPLGHSDAAMVFDADRRLLPRIDASRRAERPLRLLPGVADKETATVGTGERAARIAAFGVVRCRREYLSALLARQRPGYIPHLISIPERLAEAPCI